MTRHYRYLIKGWITALGILLFTVSVPLHAVETSPSPEAPGREMARQATQAKRSGITVDHSRLEVLSKPFKSGPEITKACQSCHTEAESQFHQSIHWTWKADETRGKAGYSLNNFCISANKMTDKGCLSCHPSWNKGLDSINCLVCHGQKDLNLEEAFEDLKALSVSKDPEEVELAKEIQENIRTAAQSIGLPGRKNCGSCHFYGGGGDGVKHGDLDSSLTKPNKGLDVHMGIDGQDFRCTRCHTTKLHNIAGRVYTVPAASSRKSLVEDDLIAKITCESCHTGTPHKAGSKPNDHTDRVACQTCHIPAFARVNPTKMVWDWSKAGKLKDGKPYKTTGEFGKEDYLSIKGEMKWEKTVKPVYYWFNGSIESVTA
ncbi:MAG: cytochrome c3 family protein, partial [Thermodesulfobacteriota bacterium]